MSDLLKEYQEMVDSGAVESLAKVAKLCRKYTESVSDDMKRRFCKDWNIPIKVATEPYFSERLAIYNQYRACVERFSELLDTIEHVGGETNYFELYNQVKDAVITYLNENEDMIYFKEKEDMNKFKSLTGFPTGSVFKKSFIGKKLLSIDLRKGNFTALKYYNPAIVGDCETYDEFMSMFTQESYIRDSKYIRQVIFGNVNPKRQVTYEKYMMSLLLKDLLSVVSEITVVAFNSDEIILNADSFEESTLQAIRDIVERHKKAGINTHTEYYKLGYMQEVDTYYKYYLDTIDNVGVELKCMTAAMMPYAIKALYRNPVRSHDAVFELDGKLAKWVNGPKVSSRGLPKVKYSWVV